jgi:hypothetical protein
MQRMPEQPIRQWVLNFPFQLRFLFACRPELIERVLGIVFRAILSHLIKKLGYTRKTAQTGAVTLIQRFGSVLNLNVHFQMLFLDGVYTTTPWGKSRFHRINVPGQQELVGKVSAFLPICHCQAVGTGAETPSEPDPVPWRICLQHQTPC